LPSSRPTTDQLSLLTAPGEPHPPTHEHGERSSPGRVAPPVADAQRQAPAKAPKPSSGEHARRSAKARIASPQRAKKKRVLASQVVADHHMLRTQSVLASARFATAQQVATATRLSRSDTQKVLRHMQDLGWVAARHNPRPGGGRRPSFYTHTPRGHQAARRAGESEDPQATYPPRDSWWLPQGPYRAHSFPDYESAGHDLAATDAALSIIGAIHTHTDEFGAWAGTTRWRREVLLQVPAISSGAGYQREFRPARWNDATSGMDQRLKAQRIVTDRHHLRVLETDHFRLGDPVAPIRPDALIEHWGETGRRQDLLLELDYRTQLTNNLTKLAAYNRLLTVALQMVPRYQHAAPPWLLFITTDDRRIERLERFAIDTAVRIVVSMPFVADFHDELRLGPERIVFVSASTLTPADGQPYTAAAPLGRRLVFRDDQWWRTPVSLADLLPQTPRDPNQP
jgi:hypothetical protein